MCIFFRLTVYSYALIHLSFYSYSRFLSLFLFGPITIILFLHTKSSIIPLSQSIPPTIPIRTHIDYSIPLFYSTIPFHYSISPNSTYSTHLTRPFTPPREGVKRGEKTDKRRIREKKKKFSDFG